jgi:hypothetical protein
MSERRCFAVRVGPPAVRAAAATRGGAGGDGLTVGLVHGSSGLPLDLFARVVLVTLAVANVRDAVARRNRVSASTYSPDALSKRRGVEASRTGPGRHRTGESQFGVVGQVADDDDDRFVAHGSYLPSGCLWR